ncbi:hypothetical protein Asp14428_57590 [Actinoplanes sp. NBRC 14428]|nr:hypothetical protein Asp14428_57590 [Actinoplanes sp. NBRC 14428]
MHTMSGRRELAIVFALAVLGLALVGVVAFAPWYGSVSYGDIGPSVIETIPRRWAVCRRPSSGELNRPAGRHGTEPRTAVRCAERPFARRAVTHDARSWCSLG